MPVGSTDAAPATGRRRDLLDAAVQVLAQTGLRGLTHRAVDAQAGVPQGSTSTYYRTRLALLSALTAHVAQELLAGIEVLGARVAALPEMADDELARPAPTRSSMRCSRWPGVRPSSVPRASWRSRPPVLRSSSTSSPPGGAH